MFGLLATRGRAEIVFHDYFTGNAGPVTNHTPWIDYHNDGWSPASNARLDGQGHLVSGGVDGALAGFPLLATGPHGFMTATVTFHLPADPGESLSFGFNTTTGALNATNTAGPWLRVRGDGSVTLFEGSAQGKSANALLAGADAVQMVFTFDVFQHVATASVGGTNTLFDATPLAAGFQPGGPKYFVIQFNGANGGESGGSLDEISLDWFPRFRPLLAFESTNTVLHVDPPSGSNDVPVIQKAFNTAAKSKGPVEVRFPAGKTYMIDSTAKDSGIPLILTAATNVLVNG
ncbi:MAG TPA: hypothetical protein VHH73_18395, partial [Verrucomicrobiae bacterium]|nr:hypothetical protein [Verrucomicrobiae bacterium]